MGKCNKFYAAKGRNTKEDTMRKKKSSKSLIISIHLRKKDEIF